MSRTARPGTIAPRLAWAIWVLLIASAWPFSVAEGVWPLALVAGVVGALGIYLSSRAERVMLGPRTAGLIVGGLALLVIFEMFSSGSIRVFPVANWLLAVAVVKCWQLGSSRDCMEVLVITLLLYVVGALVSPHLNYAISLLALLLVGPYAAMGCHLLAEAERLRRLRSGLETARQAHDPLACAGVLGGVSLAATGACVLVGFVLFATFPRMRTPLQPNLQNAGYRMTGFSTETDFGEIGQLQQSDRIALRARILSGGQPTGSDTFQFYFRGATYSVYTGRRWTTLQRQDPYRVTLSNDGRFKEFRPLRSAHPLGEVEQEYWAESGSLSRLFVLAEPIAIASQEMRHIGVTTHDAALIPPDRMPPTVHYRVRSVPPNVLLEEQAQPLADGQPAEPPAEPTVIPPRVGPQVRRLAESLVADIEDPSDPANREIVVNRMRSYLLSGEFSYSLDAEVHSPGRAVEQFLLTTRRGYCEHFATALAVMCQAVGVPARYVTGYHGGEYNDVGQFYAIRDSDAHSWVEVWMPGRGWIAVDPTPPDGGRSRRSSLGKRLASLLDYLQFQWSSWIVAYDILHREELLGTFGGWMEQDAYRGEHPWMRFAWTFGQLLKGPETLSPLGKVLYWLGLLGVLVLTGYVAARSLQQIGAWWKLRRRVRAARQAGVPFYERVVAALARRGLIRRPAETPREFAGRVERTLPHLKGRFAQLIEQYYSVRFGDVDETRIPEETSREVLERLRHANGHTEAAHESAATTAGG